MANSMVIKKVKIVNEGKRDCIKIEYVLGREEVDDDLTGVFREQAAPEFYQAFRALTEHVEEILEIGSKGLGERIIPYGVAFSYAKDGSMGAIISSKFVIPGAQTYTILNTPLRRCLPDEDAPGVYFTEAAAEALWKVESETRKFISGKRAQTSLFGDNGEVEEEQESEAV